MALVAPGMWPICIRGELGAEALDRRLWQSGSTSEKDPVFIFLVFLPENALLKELRSCQSTRKEVQCRTENSLTSEAM